MDATQKWDHSQKNIFNVGVEINSLSRKYYMSSVEVIMFHFVMFATRLCTVSSLIIIVRMCVRIICEKVPCGK